MSDREEAPPPPTIEEIRGMIIALSLNQNQLGAILVNMVGVMQFNVVGKNHEIRSSFASQLNEVFQENEKILDRLLGSSSK